MNLIGDLLSMDRGVSAIKKLYVATGSVKMSPRRGASIGDAVQGSPVTTVTAFTE